MDPLNEFLSEYGEKKEAALGPAGSRFRDAVVGGVAAAGAAGVVGGVSAVAQRAYDAVTKSHDFKQMLSYNADLHEHHARDPRMFNQMYTSLRSMNPQYAKDPLVAGSFMRRMVDMPNNPGGVLTDAAPKGSGGSLPRDITMAGANAGAMYYTGLAQARGRRDSEPNADLKSQYEAQTMKREMNDPLHDLRQHHEKARMDDYMSGRAQRHEDEQMARGFGKHGGDVTPVKFDPHHGVYGRHNPQRPRP